MKKFFLTTMALLLTLGAMAQSTADRTLQLYYGGEIIYSRALSQLDSLNFIGKLNGDEEGDGSTIDEEDQIYIGVVGFHKDIFPYEITNNLEGAKDFIQNLDNDFDKTTFAYSVSRGNKMFDTPGLPEFDKIFMLNFSDGTDNGSSSMWLTNNGRRVNQALVYDTARYDISQREKLDSYAIGFGASEGDFRERMRKVVLGNGYYKSVSSSNELQSVFNEVANSIIASSKNVSILTQNGVYDEEFPKILRLRFESGLLKDSIDISVVGDQLAGYKLNIVQRYNNYISLDDSIQGIVRIDVDKLEIPLNNLKFIVNDEEQQFEFDVIVSTDGGINFIVDVEEASKAESISKRIAVVLVLDCSTSMGEAFEPMKEAAIDFIETLENMDPNAEFGTIRIKFDANGGEGTMPSATFEQNTYQYIPNNTFTHSTLVFKGWNTKADGSGDSYTNGQYFYANQNMTLYAQWEEIGLTGMENGYEWVDLGLSVKWATKNVGASEPEYNGSYYAWGETSTKTSYTNSNYYYSNNPSILPASKDAANYRWGGNWRMPTKEEAEELMNNCTWTQEYYYGVYGYRVKSKVNDNSIFIPFAGYNGGSSSNSGGWYWTSTYNSSSKAYVLSIGSSIKVSTDDRYYGNSIRAVLP